LWICFTTEIVSLGILLISRQVHPSYMKNIDKMHVTGWTLFCTVYIVLISFKPGNVLFFQDQVYIKNWQKLSLKSHIMQLPGWPTGPTFPTFPYFLIQSPSFPYFLRKQPYCPYFLGCHVVKLYKEHLKHVFLHWFST